MKHIRQLKYAKDLNDLFEMIKKFENLVKNW